MRNILLNSLKDSFYFAGIIVLGTFLFFIFIVLGTIIGWKFVFLGVLVSLFIKIAQW